MLKLSRKSEYALMAVRLIAAQPGGRLVNVAAIADAERLPRQLLAKVMQDLKRAGIVVSTKGAAGGYSMSSALDKLRFLEVIAPFEEQLGLVDCVASPAVLCERSDCCSLRDPMMTLNAYVMQQLGRLTMAEFLALQAPAAPCSGEVRTGSLSLGVAASR